MNECIRLSGSDEWKCVCGNTAEDEGFAPCTPAGVLCEPVAPPMVPGGRWEGEYLCQECGRIITIDGTVCAEASVERAQAALSERIDEITEDVPLEPVYCGRTVREVTAKAVEAFWAKVAEMLPDAATGDLCATTENDLHNAAAIAVAAWAKANVPVVPAAPSPITIRALSAAEAEALGAVEADEGDTVFLATWADRSGWYVQQRRNGRPCYWSISCREEILTHNVHQAEAWVFHHVDVTGGAS